MRQILWSMVETIEQNWTSDPRLPCFIVSTNILPNKKKMAKSISNVFDKKMETFEAVQPNDQFQARMSDKVLSTNWQSNSHAKKSNFICSRM
jgi:hypothetical protein